MLNGHASHKSLEAIQYARTHNITTNSFPPHTTLRLQPLDKCFFGPQDAPWGCVLGIPCSQNAPSGTSYKVKHLPVTLQYLLYLTVHMIFTLKTHIQCIIYLFLLVS